MSKIFHFHLFYLMYILVALQGLMAREFLTVPNDHVFRLYERCTCREGKCHSDGGCVSGKCSRITGGPKCQQILVTDIVDVDKHDIPDILLNRDREDCGTGRSEGGGATNSFQVSGNFGEFYFVSIFFTRKQSINIDLITVNLTVSTSSPETIIHYPSTEMLKLHRLSGRSWELRIQRKDLGTFMFNKFVISNLPKDLCTLEFSLGRDLVLTRATASLSSTMGNYVAGDGIDGTISGNNVSSCTHTIVSKDQAWFEVILSNPAIVNHIVMFFREDEGRNRGALFKIVYYDDKGAAFQTYQHPAITVQREVKLFWPSKGLVKKVRMFSAETLQKIRDSGVATDAVVLTICEMILIGAFKCPAYTSDPFCKPCTEHTFGEECTPCPSNCLANECDGESGQCTDGCEDGWYFIKCDLQCSSNCFANKCDRKSGHCTDGCEDGWYYPKCDLQCSSNCFANKCDRKSGHCINGCKDGWYFFECTLQCPSNCLTNKCQRYTGECVDECKDGWHSGYCDEMCPSNCATNKCKMSTGNCVDCKVGWYSDKCDRACSDNCATLNNCNPSTGKCVDGCKNGWFSELCDRRCRNCKKDVCDQMNGRCLHGCAQYYTGDRCMKPIQPENTSSSFLLLSAILVEVVLFLSFLIWWHLMVSWYPSQRKPSHAKRLDEESSGKLADKGKESVEELADQKHEPEQTEPQNMTEIIKKSHEEGENDEESKV